MARQLYCYLQSGFCPRHQRPFIGYFRRNLIYSAGCEAVNDLNDEHRRNSASEFSWSKTPEHCFIAVTVIHQVLGERAKSSWPMPTGAVELNSTVHDTDRPESDAGRPCGCPTMAVLRCCGGRARDPYWHVPIFVITSSLYDLDIAQSYELGACGAVQAALPCDPSKKNSRVSASSRPSRVCTSVVPEVPFQLPAAPPDGCARDAAVFSRGHEFSQLRPLRLHGRARS